MPSQVVGIGGHAGPRIEVHVHRDVGCRNVLVDRLTEFDLVKLGTLALQWQGVMWHERELKLCCECTLK